MSVGPEAYPGSAGASAPLESLLDAAHTRLPRERHLLKKLALIACLVLAGCSPAASPPSTPSPVPTMAPLDHVLAGIDAIEKDINVLEALLGDGMDEPLFAAAVGRIEALAAADEAWMQTADIPGAIKGKYHLITGGSVDLHKLFVGTTYLERQLWSTLILPLERTNIADARRAIAAIQLVSP